MTEKLCALVNTHMIKFFFKKALTRSYVQSAHMHKGLCVYYMQTGVHRLRSLQCVAVPHPQAMAVSTQCKIAHQCGRLIDLSACEKMKQSY